LEDLEAEELEYTTVGGFLAEIKREFRDSKDSRVEKNGAGRKDNGGVCSRI